MVLAWAIYSGIPLIATQYNINISVMLPGISGYDSGLTTERSFGSITLLWQWCLWARHIVLIA